MPKSAYMLSRNINNMNASTIKSWVAKGHLMYIASITTAASSNNFIKGIIIKVGLQVTLNYCLRFFLLEA